jgi:hypothetical protein
MSTICGCSLPLDVLTGISSGFTVASMRFAAVKVVALLVLLTTALTAIVWPAAATSCQPESIIHASDAPRQDNYSTYDFPSMSEGAGCEDYYHAQAHVWLGPELRLANGVSWRLLIDAHTDTRAPRITWMPNQERMLKANRMFDIVHGRSIANAHDIEGILRQIFEKQRRDEARLGLVQDVWEQFFSFHGDYHQLDVALTYASDRFVSYREFGKSYWDYAGWGPIAKGQVFDLAQGTFFGAEACPGEHHSYGRPSALIGRANGRKSIDDQADMSRYFVFGSLLYLCDEEHYAPFRALVVKWANKSIPEVDRHLTRDRPSCSSWARELVEAERPALPVLTMSGLALHDFVAAPLMYPRRCPSGAVGTEPVVIPYKELAALMTPGPLRDELLTLH